MDKGEIMNEITTRKLGEQGLAILGRAQDLEKSIKEQWNDGAIDRINTQGIELIDKAKALSTDTPEDYQNLLNFHSDISGYMKTGEEYCEPFKKMAKQPHTLICNVVNMFAKPGDEAKTIVSNKIAEYREKERQREAEQKRKAEYEREQEEKRKREAEEQKAEKALEKGNEAKAEMHMANAEETYVPPKVAEPVIKKTERTEKGTTSFVKDHRTAIIKKSDIIKAVSEGKLPETFLDVNEGAIKKWAKACGHKNYKAHGIHIWEFERPVSRNARRG
jgi:hypothetical protein